MKKESTATRLKQIMKERHLRQVDILEKCKPFCQKFDIKLGRNDLSQYVNGKVEPGQEKLTILGMALNVSEAWLMGFDVPMERTTFTKESSPKIMQYYEQLNNIGKHEAIKRVEELTYIDKYICDVTNENMKTDTEFSNEMHFTEVEKATEFLKTTRTAAFGGLNSLNPDQLIQMANIIKNAENK